MNQLPPHNKSMEEAVLGSLMLSKDALFLSMGRLFPEIFYSDRHKEVFVSIRNLYDANGTVDTLTVFEQLRRSGSHVTAFDLLSMQKQVTGFTQLETHIQFLAELFVKREVIRIGMQSAAKGYDDSVDAFDLANQTGAEIEKAQETVLGGITKDLPAYVMEMLRQHTQVKETGVMGLKTGLETIDGTVGGLVSPDLIIIAARPGQGKTALALSITKNLTIDRKVPGAWFSLEMDGVQLVRRLTSMHSGIDHSAIREGRTKPNEDKLLQDSAAYISECPLFIEDKPSVNIRDVKTRAHVLHKKHGIKYLVLDYLQLMDGGDAKNKSREQVVSEISRGLKVLAKELDIPVIALSQLNRSVETRADRLPNLSDLRESGAIEQDADEVMFIMRPEYYMMTEPVKIGGIMYDPNELAIVSIAKNRHGETGNHAARFSGSKMQFSNY